MFDNVVLMSAPDLPLALRQLQAGGIVVLRLPDGTADLVMSGERATARRIAFYVRHTSGMIQVALPADRCDELDLPPMAGLARDEVSAVAVDASSGVSTGISATDRARTICVLAECGSGPADLRRPGHVLPLRARPHGVLAWAGRAEAAVDLCRLAGLQPAGVLAELIGPRGDLARDARVFDFAAEHGLPVVMIDQVLAHRRRFDTLVERVADCRLPTEAGTFRALGYRCLVDVGEHVALVTGDLTASASPLVRVHRECLQGDAFGSLRCECGGRLSQSLREVATSGQGVVLYLRGALGRGTSVTPAAPVQHDFAIAAAILRELGVHRFRALVSAPVSGSVARELGLDIVECIPLSDTVASNARRHCPPTAPSRREPLLPAGSVGSAPRAEELGDGAGIGEDHLAGDDLAVSNGTVRRRA